jgi:hypothetical protein
MAAKKRGAAGDGVGGAQDTEVLRAAISRAVGKQFQAAPPSAPSSEEEASEEEEAEEAAGGGSEDGAGDAPASASGAPDAAAAAAERAEVAALLAAENVKVLSPEERERLTLLDALTGIPRADDTLLHAVPMCGPYSAMSNFKFKVKLIPGARRSAARRPPPAAACRRRLLPCDRCRAPAAATASLTRFGPLPLLLLAPRAGTVKKGKAAKQAAELLSRLPEASARERELLKAVPDAETINTLVGTVKLSVAGLQKLKTAEKQARKANRQAVLAGAGAAAAGGGGGGGGPAGAGGE